MTSIIQEIQLDATNHKISLLYLLRKAKLIATKLDLEDFLSWIKKELNGYGTEQVPEYRIMYGEPKGLNIYQGRRVDVMIEEEKTQRLLSKIPITQGISELEDLIQNRSDNGILVISYPARIQLQIAKMTSFNTKYRLEVSYTAMVGVLESVRDLILDRSINLEKQGIVGDGLVFSNNEKKIVHSDKNTNQFLQNNFYGDISTVNAANQMNIYTKEDITRIIGIYEQLIEYIDKIHLDKTVIKEINNGFEQIKEASKSKKDETPRIKKIISKTIGFLSNVASNIIASGSVEALSAFL